MSFSEAGTVYLRNQTDLATWLTVIVSAAGVLVTVVYVVLTYRLVRANERSTVAAFHSATAAREGAIAGLESARESRAQRRIATEPLLAAEQADVSWYGDTLQSFTVRMKNYGDGPAFAVNTKIRIKELNAEQLFSGGPLLSSASAEVDFGRGLLDWQVGGISDAEIVISCRDIYGAEHSWLQSCVLKGGEARVQISTWPSASVLGSEAG